MVDEKKHLLMKFSKLCYNFIIYVINNSVKLMFNLIFSSDSFPLNSG